MKITKDDFVSHFNQVFFSPESKRMDLMLTAEVHKDEQEEYRLLNEKHAVLEGFERQVYSDIASFKKQQGMYPDVYKTNYSKFLS